MSVVFSSSAQDIVDNGISGVCALLVLFDDLLLFPLNFVLRDQTQCFFVDSEVVLLDLWQLVEVLDWHLIDFLDFSVQ